MTTAVAELRQRLATLTDLHNVAGLLGWDQQTQMPTRGGENRAEQMATMERLSHEMFIAPETGRLLEAAAAELNGQDPDGDDARIIATTRRRWEKARRVPSDLAADMARASALAHEVWVNARAENDYASFQPYLQKNFELARRYVDCCEGYACAYDVMLDDYDEGMTTARVETLFGELAEALGPLISELSRHQPDTSILKGDFSPERQRRLAEEVVTLMGYTPAGWRMDEAVHPFAMSLGRGDVRITTRWERDYFPAGLYAAMHECGHGLYEDGISADLRRSPVGHGSSLSVHESQSRLWENMVGRGRAFCEALAPRIAEQLGVQTDPQALFRAVNVVRPSFIRVEADEATYGLHVVLRFELEQALMDGTLSFDDLPEAWDARYRELFGIQVPSPADGVLQDVHWSAGLIGYFPTYALGNLMAGHLWQAAHQALPDLEDSLRAGELGGLREWLRETVHRHGAKFDSVELLRRVTGEELSTAPFLAYLREKLGAVYELSL